MGELKTVVGTCAAITEKPTGWTTVEVAVPNLQYPVKLDTKRSEIIDQVRSVGTAVATWTYNETESDKINEHSGKPYINRYLEGVEMGATADAGQTATSTASGNQSSGGASVDWDAKERRDYRSRSWAQTLSAFEHTIKTDEPVEDVFARLKPFQKKLYEDICQSFAYPADDSDIPF